MSTYPSIIEDWLEVSRLESVIDDVERERLNFLEDLNEDRLPLRSRVAGAVVRLGLKIDPRAVREIEFEHTAA